MPATLKVTREGLGIELRRGTFEVELDGRNVSPIEFQQTMELELPPGHHTLRVRKGRYSSRLKSFDIEDGEEVNFRTYGAMIWLRYVASIAKPDLAIALRRR